MLNPVHLPTRVVAALIVCVVLILPAASLLTSAADQVIAHEPASEGRPITPAGRLVMDATTRQPAVGALPLDFVRSPDRDGPQGRGRYLVAVNSGFGVQFNAATNRAQQSLAVIDLNARPVPLVIQNVYFPTPQSVNVGVVFAPQPNADGAFVLYVSGGVENKIWQFRFTPAAPAPISPASSGPNTKIEAPFIDLSALADAAPTMRYNGNHAVVYPIGLAISADGDTLYVANNLGDSLGIIEGVRGRHPTLARVSLIERGRSDKEHFVYPYGVAALPAKERKGAAKVYVSLWNEQAVAVVSPDRAVKFIPVARHPTAMIFNARRTRLYVANSNADSISVIDTASDNEAERIDVRLSDTALIGSSPEDLALSENGETLYVADAHSNAVVVVSLSSAAQGKENKTTVYGERPQENDGESSKENVGGITVVRKKSTPAADHSHSFTPATSTERSRVRGFIPTGQYPSAVAVVGQTIFVGNGKGTGVENSSLVVNNSGRAPNVANDRFPTGTGRSVGAGGEYSVAIVAGTISAIEAPDAATLAEFTRQVMRNDGLLGAASTRLFRDRSPFKHIIYVIKENRTYDQVFGDVERAGDGERADGDPSLAIFGATEAARRPNGPPQNITPNQHALALRFGLLDRFFTNSEASPDGHNWSTAAFSTDYVDKAFRWEYSGRGRIYDYEGFNRLPDTSPRTSAPPLFNSQVSAAQVEDFVRRFIPYLHHARDVAEPESLYLWDAAKGAGMSYRNYGEFIGTLSQKDLEAINANRRKDYPDLSPTVSAIPTKQTLEGHYSPTFRNFDLATPDALTIDSYRAAKEAGDGREIDPLIGQTNGDARWRGASRLGEWLAEFQTYVADLKAGRPDRLPNLSIVRFPNDHTAGMVGGMPTPQFFVAENDYAVGRLVETISTSPYWRDTAIFIVEDDAQDGPDHVDAHRSPALVISAYNRFGAYLHTFHNTVSLIRTLELLLGIPAMNQLDASAAPIDIFRDGEPDLRPFKAMLPDVALNNLLTPAAARDAPTAYWMRRTAEQHLEHADMADASVLNQSIWFSVRGVECPMPESARLPLVDALSPGEANDARDADE